VSDRVVVEVLGSEIPLEAFSLDKIPDNLFKWELGGITDPIGQLIGFAIDVITGNLSAVKTDIISFFASLIGGVKKDVGEKVDEAKKDIKDHVTDKVDSSKKDITSTVISTTIDIKDHVTARTNNVINAVDLMKLFLGFKIDDTKTKLSDDIQKTGTTLGGLIDQTSKVTNYNIFETRTHLSGKIDTSTATVISEIDKTRKAIAAVLSTIGLMTKEQAEMIATLITTTLEVAYSTQQTAQAVQQMQQQQKDIWASIGEFFTKTVPEFFTVTVPKFFTEDVPRFFTQDLPKAFFEGVVKPLIDFFTKTLPEVFIKEVIPFILDIFGKVAGTIIGGLKWIYENVVVPAIKGLWGAFKTLAQGLSWLFSEVTTTIGQFLLSPFAALWDLSKKILSKGSPHGSPGPFVEALLKGMPFALFMASIPLLLSDLGETEIQLLGTKLKLSAKTLREIGRHLFMMGTLAAVGPLWSILGRIGELSIRREYAEFAWIEIPTVHECIEMLNRSLITADDLEWVITSRGYNKVFVSWIMETKGLAIETRATKMFGEKITAKEFVRYGLRYDMPTVSDLCRFMIKDVFLKPEDFVQVMKLRGVPEHLAYAYYLLHFKYPGMEKLWEFYCRVLAHEYLQQQGVVVKSMLWLIPSLGKTVSSKDVRYALGKYAKWQDYCDVSWFKGDPNAGTMQNISDNEIIREMMADIPMRIDARWMYKWGIITDKELLGIVIARGMAPSWWKPIAMAEAMNALAEERTLARTGPLNAFKEGFMTYDGLKNVLGGLTKITILGQEVTVKFLPGEVELLSLRARYDRFVDIVRDHARELIRSYADNIITYDDFKNGLKTAISKLAENLKLPVSLDEGYWDSYKVAMDQMKAIYTIHRLRTWVRYMMYRILWRFAEGYVSDQELESVVTEIAAAGKLTDAEKQFIKDIAKFMLDGFIKQTKAMAILKRVSRGVMKASDAVEALTKLGMTRDVAEALVERYARIYTLSPATYASMMEYIPIDLNKLMEKCINVGMPEDEVKLYPAYAFARMISSEVGRYVTELINDYVDGLIDENQLRKELDDIATLWGQAKTKLGVDWVVLHPLEREFFIALAKRRKARREAREKARGSRGYGR